MISSMQKACIYEKGQKCIKKNHSISTRMEKIKQNETSKQIQLTMPNNSKSVKQLELMVVGRRVGC